jgi:glutamate racemase
VIRAIRSVIELVTPTDSEAMPHTFPRVLVFDSGLGGLTVLRRLREAMPEALFTYLADDTCFPYGALSDEALINRVGEVVSNAIGADRPDAVVIACNTASTVVLPSLRAAHTIPFVGTVPAVKPAAALSETSMISILGTTATVRRVYTRKLIATHGREANFTLVGSPWLARLAETVMRGEDVPDASISAEIAPCFVEADGKRTDVVVLGCTHYPLLLKQLRRLAPWPVNWLDPAPAIARRTANVLAERGFTIGVGAARAMEDIAFTSGKRLSLSEIFKGEGVVLHA